MNYRVIINLGGGLNEKGGNIHKQYLTPLSHSEGVSFAKRCGFSGKKH
jgi:hypothetical protein